MMRLIPPFAVSCLLALPAMAQGNRGWTLDETSALAMLPTPQGQTRVIGASLSCEAQRWRLEIDIDGDSTENNATAENDATLAVDGRAFALRRTGERPNLAFMIPRAAIEPLKSGLRLELATADEPIAFSLRGSMVAIAAVQERCTPRDMSAYTPVTFTPYSSYINLGRELRQHDIAAFRTATASDPTLEVAMAEFDGGRRVLFTRLCGSSWYYGASGCNITGFAPDGGGDDDGWRNVYDTENVILHTDPKTVIDGWPDLVTLPSARKGNVMAGPGLIWRWDGNSYALKGELAEEAGPEEKEIIGKPEGDAQIDADLPTGGVPMGLRTLSDQAAPIGAGAQGAGN